MPAGLGFAPETFKGAAAGGDAGDGCALDLRVPPGDHHCHVLSGGPEKRCARKYEQHVEQARHLRDRQAVVCDCVGILIAALAHFAAPLSLQCVQPPVLVQLHTTVPMRTLYSKTLITRSCSPFLMHMQHTLLETSSENLDARCLSSINLPLKEGALSLPGPDATAVALHTWSMAAFRGCVKGEPFCRPYTSMPGPKLSPCTERSHGWRFAYHCSVGKSVTYASTSPSLTAATPVHVTHDNNSVTRCID